MNFLDQALLTYMVMSVVIIPALRTRAWEISITSSVFVQEHPGSLATEWTLWGKSPGMDARGLLQLVVNTPMYVFKALYTIFIFPALALQWYLNRDPLHRITDKNVFDLCTHTSLVLLLKRCNDDDDNEQCWVFEMKKQAPQHFPVVGNCHASTLRIKFHGETRKILEASSKNGPVEDVNLVGRNEILIISLRNIIAMWIHPTIHVGAEKNALEIQHKRIEQLEPSVHFVSALHDGLLHGPFGPLSESSPFFANTETAKDVVANAFSQPTPPHVLHEDKMQFEIYAFLIAGRQQIYRLVRKYNLQVDAEYLFMNLVMHEIDHEMTYEILSDLPLCSSDASGTLWSCWQNHCFTMCWTLHWDNPLSSSCVTVHLDKPFYRELHQEMTNVNPKRANQMLVSCCF